MSRKRLLLISVVLLAGATVWWWITRPRLSDKEQIARVIDQLRSAVEQKSPGRVMVNISKQYYDSLHTTYRDIDSLAKQLLRVRQEIRVNILDYKEPIIQDDIAQLALTVEIDVLDSGESIEKLSGDLEFTLGKESGGWKLIQAEGWHEWPGKALGME
jgi:hypothetical protein